jgi:uncharacterized protein
MLSSEPLVNYAYFCGHKFTTLPSMVRTGKVNYLNQLAILLGLFGAGFIISSFVILFIGLKAAGISDVTSAMSQAKAIEGALLKPENAGYAQAANIAGTFFMMFLPSAVFIFICYRKSLWAGFSTHFNLAQLFIGFLIMFAANAVAGPFAEISKSILSHFPSLNSTAKSLEDTYTAAIGVMSNLKGWNQYIVAIFVVAFFPALFEELAFRGVVQNFITKWTNKPVLAIVIASVLFSLIHGSYYLFLSRFVLGYALGLMFYYTKNIWVNVVAHFLNNLIALSVLFYSNMQGKPAVVNDIDTKMPIWGLLIAVAILYGLFVALIRVSKNNRNRIAAKEAVAFGNEPLLS